VTGPPDFDTILLNYPWIVIRFRCQYCERSRDARLAACVARFGTRCTLRRLLDQFVMGCPWTRIASCASRRNTA
jgi:hypothetical protein